MGYEWNESTQGFQWVGPGLEPTIGMTREEYDAQAQQQLGPIPMAGPILPAIGAALTPWVGPIVGAVGGWLFGDAAGGGNGGADLQTGLPFVPQGPGVPEPPAAMVSKAWKIKATRSGVGGILGEITGQNEWWVFFWRLLDGRTVMYNPMKRQWKMWRDYKSITIGKGITTQNAKRVAKRFKQHVKSLQTVMRIVK